MKLLFISALLITTIGIPLLANGLEDRNKLVLLELNKLSGSHEHYSLKDNGWVDITFFNDQITTTFHFPNSEILEIEDHFRTTGKRMVFVHGEALVSTPDIQLQDQANPNESMPTQQSPMNNDLDDITVNPNFSLGKILSETSISYLEGIPQDLMEAIQAKTSSSAALGMRSGAYFDGIQQKSMEPNHGMDDGPSSSRLLDCVSCALGILSYASEIAAIATAPANLGFGAAAALVLHPATVATIAYNCPKAVQGGKK